MQILYALVARGQNVLAEYTVVTGNFTTITRLILTKIPSTDAKMSYMYDEYVFHYIVENNIVYMCMCDEKEKRRIPFGFLEDMKQRFIVSYGNRAQTEHAYAMNNEFSPVLKKQMEFYNSAQADSFAQVNSKLDDVKNVMMQNIEALLERGEKLELLVDKTEKLSQSAFQFKKQSNQLKLTLFWRKIKLYILIFFVIAIVCVIISAVICGAGFKKCNNDK